MDKNTQDAKFTIEGNPGQNNTFINIGTAYNVNPNATKVENTFIIGSREEGDAAVAEATNGKKLGAMTLREMLKKDMVDTGNIQKEILNYVSCIRPKLKANMDKKYEHLWARIVGHEAFAVDLYDPGKQQCTYNRNLVANIIHYLDSKGIYKDNYNATTVTVALEGDKDHTVRSSLGKDPVSDIVSRLDRFFETFEA